MLGFLTLLFCTNRCDKIVAITSVENFINYGEEERRLKQPKKQHEHRLKQPHKLMLLVRLSM